MPVPADGSRGRRTSPLIVLPAAALFLAAIWSVLWLFLFNGANGAVDGWLAAEAAAGRQWTCPGRRIGGYPFALALHCDRPTFRGEVAGRSADGVAEALDAEIRLDHARRLDLVLRGPLVLRSEADDFALTLSWAALAGAVDGLGGRTMRGTLETTRLAATLQTVRQGDLNLRAATASLGIAPAGADARGAAFDLAAEGVVLPTVGTVPGLEGPTALSARGVLGRADLLRAPTRACLEAWRTAGGALALASLVIDAGALRGQGSGALTLDEGHRPAGRLDADVSGFEPIAARLGIPLAGVRLGGMLSSLLSGGKGAGSPDSIRVPLRLEDGALSVGPVRTGVRLDPWY